MYGNKIDKYLLPDDDVCNSVLLIIKGILKVYSDSFYRQCLQALYTRISWTVGNHFHRMNDPVTKIQVI